MRKVLSVIVPLYNSSRWLPKCLDSIMAQDILADELEIICVDDGSPDDSAAIVERYREQYPETIVLLQQTNQGPSGARNKGMQHATGKYLCFVDPDDYLIPHVYNEFVEQMEREQLDILRFNHCVVDEDYREVAKPLFEQRFDYTPQLMTGVDFLSNRLDIACNIWRYVYRTDIIKENRIWCFTGDYYDDTPWLPMVLLVAKRLNVTDRVGYCYLERSDSLVKAQSPTATRRKIEGQKLLLRLLDEERRIICGENGTHPNMQILHSLNLDEKDRQDVLRWYHRMMSHSAISLATMVAITDYTHSKDVIRLIENYHLMPLPMDGNNGKGKMKRLLFNCFPRLVMWQMYRIYGKDNRDK